jgi:hypothetical protein
MRYSSFLSPARRRGAINGARATYSAMDLTLALYITTIVKYYIFLIIVSLARREAKRNCRARRTVHCRFHLCTM